MAELRDGGRPGVATHDGAVPRSASRHGSRASRTAPGRQVDASSLWDAVDELAIHEDTTYGQWGFRLLSEVSAAEVTASLPTLRPGTVTALGCYFVFGEFLGDAELAALDEGGQVWIVPGGIDPPHQVATNLFVFLELFLVGGSSSKPWPC